MEELFSIGTYQDWLNVALVWLGRNVINVWTLVQLAILFCAMALSSITARASTVVFSRLGRRVQLPPRLEPLRETLYELRKVVAFLILLWIAIGVMREVTWPSRSYLLGVFASLATAWIVIRLGSGFIRNAALSRLAALAIWTLAALNITGLLQPTLHVLDSIGMTFGDLRVSILVVIKALVALAILLWGASELSRLLERRISRIPDFTPSVQVLLGKLLKIVLITLAIVIALNSVGIDLTGLALFSGAIGVGLGFGLQKVVSNLISGVILLLDKSIKPGDVIEIGNTFGWIGSLSARFVSVRTRDGKEFLIPNEDLITQQVVNWSYTDQLVRLEVSFGVSYDCSPHEVRKLACEAVAHLARVVDNRPPVCHFVAFGESSLDFVLRFWIADPQNGVMNVRGEALLALWDAFTQNGIAIPYPHREVIIRDPVRVETVPPSGS